MSSSLVRKSIALVDPDKRETDKRNKSSKRQRGLLKGGNNEFPLRKKLTVDEAKRKLDEKADDDENFVDADEAFKLNLDESVKNQILKYITGTQQRHIPKKKKKKKEEKDSKKTVLTEEDFKLFEEELKKLG